MAIRRALLLSCAAVCLACSAQAGAEELMSPAQIANTLREAKRIRISNVRRDLGSPTDSYAPACRRFRLSAAQISAFLRLATPITANEWHYEFLQLPCEMTGHAHVGRLAFHWRINASATAWVSQLPVSGEESLILACKAGCEARKPFNAVAGPDEVLDHHVDLPVK